jgi:Ran GTPase-activating protein (RanGAP) involved in mRNA processing and transport
MQSLDLSWNGLEDAGTGAICRALSSNQVLKSLDIAAVRAGVNACVALGEALRVNTSLQELSMAKNLIGQVGAGHIMAALTSNHSLKFLTLKVRACIKLAFGLLQCYLV